VVATSAAVAGLFAPPVTTLTRTAWRHRFEREDDRRTAFALDAVMIELNFTVGPAIVATILATAGAMIAFATTIVSVLISAAIFLGSPAMRYFKPEAGVERHLFGPLTEPRLWLVFLATFGLTLCFGQLEVGYPAYATALSMPAFAGVLLAVNSIGSALGGAVFGGLHFKAPVERQLAAAMGLMSIPVALHAVAPTPFAFGVAAFFAGVFIAPSIACQSVLVSRLAPARYATEAFTWSGTFILTGLGAGMSLGGYLVEHVGLRSGFISGAAVVATMALVALQIGAPRAQAAQG
jgi:predicted MFS family arabinose efflux permease